jgi:hypothetical protein
MASHLWRTPACKKRKASAISPSGAGLFSRMSFYPGRVSNADQPPEDNKAGARVLFRWSLVSLSIGW